MIHVGDIFSNWSTHDIYNLLYIFVMFVGYDFCMEDCTKLPMCSLVEMVYKKRLQQPRKQDDLTVQSDSV